MYVIGQSFHIGKPRVRLDVSFFIAKLTAQRRVFRLTVVFPKIVDVDVGPAVIDQAAFYHASYTNLSPGTYHLKIYVANNTARHWGDQCADITVIIDPPFWKTPWAYAFYLLLLAAGLYFTISYYIRWNKHKMQVQQKTDLDQLKYSFFTNVSHASIEDEETGEEVVINPVVRYSEPEDEDKTMWDTPIRKTKMYVNGVDVSALISRELYFDNNGKPITVSLKDYTRQVVMGRYASLDDFLKSCALPRNERRCYSRRIV